MDAVTGAPILPPAPSVRRRLACLPYEGLLLFALLLIASFPMAGLRQVLPADAWLVGYQAYLLAVLAAYFVWFWTHGGQTLPMKTWRFRVTRIDGAPLAAGRALARAALACLFFLPSAVALALVLFPHRVSPLWSAWLCLPAVATIWWATFDKDRQFLHDRMAGTRLEMR
jgi:uncharacterized RDD family membrane protein YckC